MAKYEHLPIFRDAYALALNLEKIVSHFSRYHKYTLGTELREQARLLLRTIIAANNSSDKRPHLLELRISLEYFKTLSRLCHDSKAYASTKSYLHIADQLGCIARQNEGWLKNTGS